MKAWSTGIALACGLAYAVAQGQNTETKSRLETIATSYTPGTAFMGRCWWQRMTTRS